MILITGSSGFIGTHLKHFFNKNNINYITDQKIKKSTYQKDYNWMSILKDIKVVIHLIGKAHNKTYTTKSNKKDFQNTNVKLTESLVRQSIKSGVTRFIYISSVKVYGEKTDTTNGFSTESITSPVNEYGKSKLEAENQIKILTKNTTTDFTIIRLPLVYGPGVKSNFKFLIKVLESGIPIPLKNINNQRSILSIHNLNDFIYKCINNPAAINQTFNLSDGTNISTNDLAKFISKALDNKGKMFYLPKNLVKFFLFSIGKKSIYNSLYESLILDTSKSERLLDWHPKKNIDFFIKETVESYLDEKIN